MLTETMTHAEVYRELERDRDTATTWWRHHLDTLRRPVLKARQLPVIHWAEYTSPARRIRYLFFTRIFDKHMRRLLTGVAVPCRTPEGYNAFCTRGVSGWLPTTERHWQMAQRISGLEKPNMFVYGGGDDVAEWCKAHDVVHVKEYMNRGREK